MSKVTILNTSIVTSYGSFEYKPITLDQARDVVSTQGFDSAIGHASTAEIVSSLLGIQCPVNRVQYAQEEGDRALVFKLNGRAPEGVILSRKEIEAIGYSWGLLIRTA